MKKIILILKIIINILLIGYPVVVFCSLNNRNFYLFIFFLIIIFILRLLTQSADRSQLYWFGKIMPFIGLFFAISSWLFTQYQLLLYYPVMVNTVLLTLFLYSLKKPPTIIERFARLKYHDLSQTEIRYTRLVTICWCYFFLFNGSIALITCFMDNLAWWTLYNGGMSYVLIGLLMGVEWLLRKKRPQ